MELLEKANPRYAAVRFGQHMKQQRLALHGAGPNTRISCDGITWPCGGEESLEEEVGEQTPVQTRSVVGKSRSKRKYVAPLVQSSERRFTRSCLESDGYRPAPILVVQPKIKKKTRARNLLMPEK
jgi:hypothetical protein